MGEGPSHNPFEPPAEPADLPVMQAGGGGYRPLATYGQRLGGSIIDNLLALVTTIPFFFLIDYDEIDVLAEQDSPLGFPTPFAVVFIGPLLLYCYQWYLTATTGQTIAKRWLRTRVLRENTLEVPGFIHGVLLRNWLFVAAGMMPGIGSCVGIADALAIFAGGQRQTLHDRVASTIVVQE